MSIRPIDTGIAALSGTLSTEDGERLDQRLDQIVGWLRELGDERPKRVLRSVALGWLADPDSLGMLYDQVRRARQHAGGDDTVAPEAEAAAGTDEAADLDAAPATGDQPTEPDEANEPDDDLDKTGQEVPDAFNRHADRQLPATVLYLHCDRTWDMWWLDGTGPITRTDAIEMLGHSRVTIKPVIDLEATISYTGYVASPMLKEQLALMNTGTCTFPSCTRPAADGDYDHITDYADGGPTDSRNGHRLCRFHHRAKTFTDWTVQSPGPGVWLWTSPGGRSYLVTGGTTTHIANRADHPGRRKRKPDAA